MGNRRKTGATSRHRPAQAAPARAVTSKVLLSACLIVKDEEKSLPDCLACLDRLVDEVIVYDTGSTDTTVELARQAGARVIEGYWDDDFGRARNASLEHCRGEWILWIDADERFVCHDAQELRGALAQLKGVDAFFVEISNFGGDGSSVAMAHRAFRLFRKATCKWYGTLHEQVDLRPGLQREVFAKHLNGAHIDHYGYLDEVVNERDKWARNLRIAEAAAVKQSAVRPGQEGMLDLNLARALAACNKFEEAQHYYDTAVATARDGLPLRAALFHRTMNLLSLARLEEAVTAAQRFGEACEKKDPVSYTHLDVYKRQRPYRPHRPAARSDRTPPPGGRGPSSCGRGRRHR